jgi:hypothetical protein
VADRLALVRRANEREAWNARAEEQSVTLLCECGHEFCSDVVVVTPLEFDEAKELDARVVSNAHAELDGSAVVRRHPRYALVANG